MSSDIVLVYRDETSEKSADRFHGEAIFGQRKHTMTIQHFTALCIALCWGLSLQGPVTPQTNLPDMIPTERHAPDALPSSLSYLALGDSYTIGESVPVYENFPYQLVQLLRGQQLPVQAPEIVAKTGWTTDELQAGINRTKLLAHYDIVTLLIGVNNQYRGRSVDQYAPEFESLLKQAIAFAGGKKERVVVLSIPDWGQTPFAKDRDREKIRREIDAYNRANWDITQRYGIHYTDITPGTREAITDASLVAGDGLHPSGKDYARWAKALAAYYEGLRWD
jgi:lysophospholipase L1-like esterase